LPPVQTVYVVGDKGTASRELVGCLKFLIIVFVLCPLLLVLGLMMWSAIVD